MESEKMKIKKEYIVLVLIIAALGIYLYMRSSDRTFYQLPEIAGLEQKDIAKIESVTLTQNGMPVKVWDDYFCILPPGYTGSSRGQDCINHNDG